MRKIKINAFLIIKSCRCSAISPEKNRVIAHYLVSKILHSSENHHVVFLDFYGIVLGEQQEIYHISALILQKTCLYFSGIGIFCIFAEKNKALLWE